MGFVLFTPGTRIATESGHRSIENLRVGDRVVTHKNGLRPISWIGRRDLSYHDLGAAADLRPILVKAGSLGTGQPERNMLVSRHHRILMRNAQLMSARAMLDHRRIVFAHALGVSYFHLLFDAHEVILANGAWSECFHPDDAQMKFSAPEQRQEILVLFPELATKGAVKRIETARAAFEVHSRSET